MAEDKVGCEGTETESYITLNKWCWEEESGESIIYRRGGKVKAFFFKTRDSMSCLYAGKNTPVEREKLKFQERA